MIVWLASFPRSGNTLLRLLCKQVFGINSSALYKDKHLSHVIETVSFRSYSALFKALAVAPETYLVKTHSQRLGDMKKAICVVRDGRASYVSYWHYRNDLEGKHYTLMQMLEDKAKCAHNLSWSGFLNSWNPLANKDILLVKYEDVLINPGKTIKSLSAFLGKRPLHGWSNDFAKWHRTFPQFFRSGTVDSWKKEWSPEHEARFMIEHAGWMRKLGYIK